MRRRVVDALQALGHSVILDRAREFLCSTKNVSIPAVTLTRALVSAGITQVRSSFNAPLTILIYTYKLS